MNQRITILIALLFIVLCLEIFAENTQNLALLYISKPLLIPILLAMIFSSMKPFNSKLGRLIVAGLIFSWLGDILLMIREMDLFIPGLSSFLIAQILYTLAFFSERSRNHSKQYASVVLFGFIAFYAAFMLFIQPDILKLNDPVLAPAVFIYGAVICMMGIAASLRKGQVSSISFRFILFGALFFIASDAILATNKFTTIDVFYPNFLVMTTYVLAQSGIVLGLIVHDEK